MRMIILSVYLLLFPHILFIFLFRLDLYFNNFIILSITTTTITITITIIDPNFVTIAIIYVTVIMPILIQTKLL